MTVATARSHAPSAFHEGCATCGQEWPCRDVLLDQLAAERQARADIERERDVFRTGLVVYADEENWTTTNLYEFPDLWIRPGENGCDIAQAALAAAPAAGRQGDE